MNYEEEIKKLQVETARHKAEFERLRVENEAAREANLIAERQRQKRNDEAMGRLSNFFGGFTEGMAFPSMERILQQTFGADSVSTRARSYKNGRAIKLDMLGYANGKNNTAWIVEIKSKANQDSLDQLLEQLRTFPEFFPEHRDKDVYGILAGVSIDPTLPPKVYKAGIYLATIHDEIFSLKVPRNFKPISYRATKKSGPPHAAQN